MCGHDGVNITLGKKPESDRDLSIDADEFQRREKEVIAKKHDAVGGLLSMPSGAATKPTGYRTILT
jgi:hypothetical protein